MVVTLSLLKLSSKSDDDGNYIQDCDVLRRILISSSFDKLKFFSSNILLVNGEMKVKLPFWYEFDCYEL